MAIKKTQLYSALWQSCDELRGGMDASQYKDYILTLLFVKYVSDKYGGDPYAVVVVPEGGSFDDMLALKGDAEIGDKMNIIISALAGGNDLKGVIDLADFNDEDKLGKGKEMVDRLTKLIAIFDDIDLSGNRPDGDDLLGDAYEYLMRNFATQSGKSKGQFYTPSEVSRILAQIVGITAETRADQTVYDPTCGSGSLLIKVADRAPRKLTVYGQEMDNATAALARMNMVMQNHVTAEIHQDNSLAAPYWKDGDQLKKHDFAVANPPFSWKSWTNGMFNDDGEDPFGRFDGFGTPPAKNGDYAFLLHILKSLKSTGKAAVILPHGVLFRGNAEAEIRRNLLKRGYIKGIIGLPANLFYGTGIPACIIVLDKENAAERDTVFMIDASGGYMKDGNKNRLRARDIHQIVTTFNQRLTQPKYARAVPLSEIEGNDYNLNIPRYIDSSAAEDLHDLTAHLNGGIPNGDIDALGAYWAQLPTVRGALFAPVHDGYSELTVANNAIKPLLEVHEEVAAFSDGVLARFEAWREAHDGRLRGLNETDAPKQLIDQLAEDMLARFADVPLIDKYDMYQRLLDFWEARMQDDVYLIGQDGWLAGRTVRELPKKKAGEKQTETPDLTIKTKKYKIDLIPSALLVAAFFEAEQTEIDQLQTAAEQATQAVAAYEEEHGGDEGLLADVIENGKVKKAAVTARLKVAKGDDTLVDEAAALTRWNALKKAEADANRAVKAAQTKLDTAVLARYATLTEAEIKRLVVDDLWGQQLWLAVTQMVAQTVQRLTARVQALAARYATPLPELAAAVDDLTAKVDAHLRQMGVSW